jgi:hypothetical protein
MQVAERDVSIPSGDLRLLKRLRRFAQALDLGSRPSAPRNLHEKRGVAVAIVARP